jgi:hypothetical protein
MARCRRAAPVCGFVVKEIRGHMVGAHLDEEARMKLHIYKPEGIANRLMITLNPLGRVLQTNGTQLLLDWRMKLFNEILIWGRLDIISSVQEAPYLLKATTDGQDCTDEWSL